VMISIFDCRSAVRKKFVPQDQTVNQDVYKGVLQRLRDSIRRRFPEMWATGKWFIPHDNARPHTALSLRVFLSAHQITVLPHAPYSPDLSPCEFFYSHDWNEHWNAMSVLTFRPFRRPWTKSSEG
jgi:histone-lysine N-methyltransferase SETMAR